MSKLTVQSNNVIFLFQHAGMEIWDQSQMAEEWTRSISANPRVKSSEEHYVIMKSKIQIQIQVSFKTSHPPFGILEIPSILIGDDKTVLFFVFVFKASMLKSNPRVEKSRKIIQLAVNALLQ